MPRKRGNGEGTIYNNGKYWVGQVTVGTDPTTGKLKRKSIYGKTKREVQEKVIAALNKVNTDTYIEPSKMTVKEWAEYWYENFKKNQIDIVTQTRYSYDLKNHVYTPFGNIAIKDLTPFHIQSYLNKMYKSGFSTETIRKVKVLLNSICKQAINMEILIKNPCNSVTLPKAEQKRHARALTKDEQKRLIEYCYKDRNDWIFIFLLGTGLRIGEALGLIWDSIDMSGNVIYVQQIASEIRGKVHIKETTKTESSRRVVPISPKIKELLLLIKENQNNEKNVQQIVFPSRNHTVKASANVRRKFNSVCENAKIDKVNVHSLRHTFATRMLESGVNIKVLSEILGHRNIQITLNIYSHVLIDTKKENMIKIDEFL